jgi:hypothetical protein
MSTLDCTTAGSFLKKMARRQSQGQFVRIVGRHYRRLSIIVEAEKHTGKEACSPKETHEGMILPSFVLFANSESKQRRKVPHG